LQTPFNFRYVFGINANRHSITHINKIVLTVFEKYLLKLTMTKVRCPLIPLLLFLALALARALSRHSGGDQEFIIVNELQSQRSSKVVFIGIISVKCFFTMSRYEIAVLCLFYFVENIFVALVNRSAIAKSALAQTDAIVEIIAILPSDKGGTEIKYPNFAMESLAPCAKHVFRQFIVRVCCPCCQEQHSDNR